MKKTIDRKSFMYLYVILNILIFVLGLVVVNKPLNYKSFMLLSISFVFYYIFNVFNMDYLKYSLKQLLVNIVLNVCLFFMSNLIFFRQNEGIIFFGLMMFYQIVAKYLILNYSKLRPRLLFVGENEYKEEIKEEVIKSKLFHLALELTEDQDIQNLIEHIEKYRIDVVVDFDSGILKNELIANYLFNKKLEGFKFFNFKGFYEKTLYKLPIKVLKKKYFLLEDGFISYQDQLKKNLKRLFDLCFAIVILIPSIPIMIIAAIIIKLESKGPIIYSQERIGENNKAFKIYKFRSMRVDSEKNGPAWAKEKDNRVTKFGNIMRKTRIDELPQLYNVIVGEMSFVGPRPERQFFIDTLEKEIPYYNLRHIVKPGLTGWAQVKYPYGASVEDAYRKLQYDLYYIKNYSLSFDILIILDTIKIVIFGKGR
ncbi:exopolysaccharide biosynthesis polyprenyl glycosylphosphotransferase [Caviibacter abscessus]|uniref:exopolysaccharide biosynthesis polyprenyl glycosylphosphotransferase n=1 Tax=Caviibacter abscessus TaxID=1766719 RepID=UPI0009EC9CEC|nr:exopolysaccharide biosynthesis polyprenyl glycosylphosphotransferase [Caviibacter abscessus]